MLQASHDAHGTVLDALEDRLTSHEIKSAANLVRYALPLAQSVHQVSHHAITMLSNTAWGHHESMTGTMIITSLSQL